MFINPNRCNSVQTLKWHIKQGNDITAVVQKGWEAIPTLCKQKRIYLNTESFQGRLLQTGVNSYERQDLKRLEINYLTFLKIKN